MGVAGRVVVGVGQSAAAKLLVDGGALAVKGRRGVAGELCWSNAELLVSLEEGGVALQPWINGEQSSSMLKEGGGGG